MKMKNMRVVARWIALVMMLCLLGQDAGVMTVFGTENGQQDNETISVSVNLAENRDMMEEDLTETVVPVQDETQAAEQPEQGEQEMDDNTLAAETVAWDYESVVSGNDLPPVRVLFVGNSFTKNKAEEYGLSIAYHLSAMAQQNGKNLQVTTLAYGGAKLKFYAGLVKGKLDYYRELKELLWQQDWDYIVLQENSMVSPFLLEEEMMPAVASLKNTITTIQPDAKLLLYMTHGYACVGEDGRSYSEQKLQQRTAAAYYEVSLKYGIEVVPAGMQFQRTRALYPGHPLYRSDSKHPKRDGYFIMATAFYYRIFGQVPKLDVSAMQYVNFTQKQADAIAGLSADGIVSAQKGMTLRPGKKAKMSVTKKAGEAVADVKFYSTDQTAVSVDSGTGKIKALSFGKAVVIAQAPDGCQAYCLINVPRPLGFSRDYYVVGIGDRLEILPEGDCENVVWKSSRPTVAGVDQDGKIVAKGAGITHITVTNRDDDSDTAGFDLYVSCDGVKKLTVSSAKVQPAGQARGAMELSWERVAGAGRYDIYRAEKQTGKYERIASVKRRKYTDDTIKTDQKYFYKVQPVYTGNVLCNGPLSSPAKGMVVSVKELQGKRIGKNRYRLSWKKNANVDGYEIYRAKRKNGKYKLVAVVKGSSAARYTDQVSNGGKACYYKVVPYWKAKKVRHYGKATAVSIK